LIANAAKPASKKSASKSAKSAPSGFEVVIGRRELKGWIAGAEDGSRIFFHAVVELSDGAVLVAGELVDTARQVRSLRLGDGRGVAMDTIEIASRGPGVVTFLGAAPTPRDAKGLLFEIESADGERFEGGVPEFGGLEPFYEFINTADASKAIAWTAKLISDATAIGGGLAAAPIMDDLLQAVATRLTTNRAGSGSRLSAHVDGAERIGAEGIVVKGWVVYDSGDPMVSCAAVSLSGARAEFPLPLPSTMRPDVVAAMASVMTDPRPDCGFVAFAPIPAFAAADAHWFLEARTRSGSIFRFPFRLAPARPERAAIEAILAWAEDSAVDLGDIFARALDAPIRLLWRRMLARRSEPVVTSFGERARRAEISIVVPLYGRLDFLKHQIARFSNDPDFIGENAIVDLVYVLDDPRHGKDFELKARLAADSYGLPFRVVDLLGNHGFSTANNVGASFATGETLILMNSDVMPKRGGWASQLARTLKEIENCGVLGCRLLFEDGSIQHAGMDFRESIMLPGAWTNEHPGKGLPVTFDPHTETKKAPCVTGACLTIPRKLYLELGGLSDDYVIGDFEDSDLCLKVREKGLEVYYTPDVELYHLERQSMRLIGDGRADWRQKLTLFNMWRHARTWGHFISPSDAA
jgi:GT2 family glycosyltransferase